MIIKRINAKYLKSLYKLGKEQFQGEFWFTKQFLKDAIKRKGLCYGAFDRKKLVGAIFVDINDKPKTWIYFFDVKKEYRHHGIGHKLIEKVEKKLSKGYYMMFVDFEEKDILAKKFYVHHGFRRVAKIRNWFGKNTFGVIYAREIKEKE